MAHTPTLRVSRSRKGAPQRFALVDPFKLDLPVPDAHQAPLELGIHLQTAVRKSNAHLLKGKGDESKKEDSAGRRR